MGIELYRDPVFDGATDPMVIFNRGERTWWMLYTSRRTTAPGAGVAWVHGTDIGVASLLDDGVGWLYRGTLDLEHEFGRNTFWAPEVVWDGGCYHMYVSYIRACRRPGRATNVISCTTRAQTWCNGPPGKVGFGSDYVNVAYVSERPGGGYRMWYKDEADHREPGGRDRGLVALGRGGVPSPPGRPQEPRLQFCGAYWMVVDSWKGQVVFRSLDQVDWEGARREEVLEASDGEAPGEGVDVGPGHHADVVVVEDRAFIIYFTHPWRDVEDCGRVGPPAFCPILAAELEDGGNAGC